MRSYYNSCFERSTLINVCIFVYVQQTWKEEIREHMKQIQSDNSSSPRFEADLIRRREDELRHAQDIREHYERKLERTNNLYMELSAVLLQLEQRERDVMK